MKKFSSKRALLLSVLSMVICVSMLIGSTFAWFTDSATANVNTIQAGNLDVELQIKNAEGNWVSAENATLDFVKATGAPAGEKTLWEPGCTYQLPELRIVNKGNLALKYQLVITGATGDTMLLDVIKFKATVTPENGATVTSNNAYGTTLISDGELLAGKYATLNISAHMDETAGNEYREKSVSGIAIKVVATQLAHEFDSKGNTYDAGASEHEFKQGVKISGIAGVADSYASIQEAYEAVKAMLVENSGLAEQPLSEEAFNAFFTDGGKITWTIYGSQKVTDKRMFSFGRAANRFGEGRHITEIDIVGGNSSASLDLSAVNGTFALPYNWWNVEESVNTALKCKNITFDGIKYMPSATYQSTFHSTIYEFDGCTFNGNLYSYQNFDVEMTIKNCVFNACEANRNNSYLKVDNKACGGAISVQNANLDIIGCTFDGNMGSAGSAMLLQSGDGLVRVTDCVFKNNKGASRGLIQTNGKVVLFMNNCQIFDNTLRTNQWGTVIHGGNPSVVCMNNCSIHNNVSQQAGGTSVCLNNDGFTVVVNTTVVGVNAKSLCRSNNSNGLFSLYDNCLLANKLDNGIVFFKEANSSVKLYNDIIGPKATNTDGSWLEKTNVVVDGELSFCNGASFDSSKGYWKWNGPSASFTKTTESAIVDRIKALDSNNGNTRLNGAFAPKFVEWVESLGGFNKDQLGTTRTTSGTWPGSVELK